MPPPTPTPTPPPDTIGLTALNNEGLLLIPRHRADVQGVNQTLSDFLRKHFCRKQTKRTRRLPVPREAGTWHRTSASLSRLAE